MKKFLHFICETILFLPGSVFLWSGTVFVIDELEEEEVEHDDDAGDADPEDHRQPAQPRSGPNILSHGFGSALIFTPGCGSAFIPSSGSESA